MVFAVLPGRQHIDDLGALIHQAAYPVPIDILRHRYLLLSGTAPVWNPPYDDCQAR